MDTINFFRRCPPMSNKSWHWVLKTSELKRRMPISLTVIIAWDIHMQNRERLWLGRKWPLTKPCLRFFTFPSSSDILRLILATLACNKWTLLGIKPRPPTYRGSVITTSLQDVPLASSLPILPTYTPLPYSGRSKFPLDNTHTPSPLLLLKFCARLQLSRLSIAYLILFSFKSRIYSINEGSHSNKF